MVLKLYNSMTRSKEDFKPLTKGKVGIYVCGPTVYGHAHLGHAKSYISLDVLVRYLRYLGYSVTYNRDFVLEPVGEMLDNIAQWVNQCAPVAAGLTEVTKEMTRQLANMLAREGSVPHREMSEQIEGLSAPRARGRKRARRRADAWR